MTERLIELKSNEFSLVYTSYIESLHKEQESDFCDVTLVGDDDITFQAHKILLSSHSTFLRSILKKHVHAHPLIYLHGINSSHLGFILDYIYKGEVQLYEDQLKDFLDAAEKLKIKNLTKNILEKDIKVAKNTSAVNGYLVLNDVDKKGVLDPKIAELFPGRENSPSSNKTDQTPTYLDILDQSVHYSKQKNKAKVINSVKPKVEPETNMNEKSSSTARSNESNMEKLNEKILKDLVEFNGAILTCKYCGQKSKNKDFILKHVKTHLKVKGILQKKNYNSSSHAL